MIEHASLNGATSDDENVLPVSFGEAAVTFGVILLIDEQRHELEGQLPLQKKRVEQLKVDRVEKRKWISSPASNALEIFQA